MPSGLAMCGNTGKVELGRRAFASQQKYLPPLGHERSPFRLFLHPLGGSSDFTFVQLCLETETEQAACAQSLCARTPICSLCLCLSVSVSCLARIGADWHGLERIGLLVGSVLGGGCTPPRCPSPLSLGLHFGFGLCWGGVFPPAPFPLVWCLALRAWLGACAPAPSFAGEAPPCPRAALVRSDSGSCVNGACVRSSVTISAQGVSALCRVLHWAEDHDRVSEVAAVSRGTSRTGAQHMDGRCPTHGRKLHDGTSSRSRTMRCVIAKVSS